MLAVHLNEVSFEEPWVEGAPHQRLRFVFPLLGRGPENEHSSLVYFELEPGNELVRHTDSAEELLFIVQGRLEVSVGDETGVVEGPSFALVPALATLGWSEEQLTFRPVWPKPAKEMWLYTRTHEPLSMLSGLLLTQIREELDRIEARFRPAPEAVAALPPLPIY